MSGGIFHTFATAFLFSVSFNAAASVCPSFSGSYKAAPLAKPWQKITQMGCNSITFSPLGISVPSERELLQEATFAIDGKVHRFQPEGFLFEHTYKAEWTNQSWHAPGKTVLSITFDKWNANGDPWFGSGRTFIFERIDDARSYPGYRVNGKGQYWLVSE